MAEKLDLPYQQAPQVAQLLAERETADAYGQTSRVEAVDKQLASLGYKPEAKAAKAAEAAAKRAAAAEGADDAKQAAPKGRSARAKHTT